MNWQNLKIVNSRYNDLKNTNINFIKRNQKNILLEDGNNYIEFLSCSYLGLDLHPKVLNAATSSIIDQGTSFASSRRRLKYIGIDILEEKLNSIYNAYSTIFSSVHLAHLGIIPLLASGKLPNFTIPKSPHFFISKTAHASMQINRGIIEQFGKISICDLSKTHELESAVNNTSCLGFTPIIMSDSIGSMGGSEDILFLQNLVSNYNGYLYLDDSHGMSVFGVRGNGYVLSKLKNTLPNRVILISSLAKAFGTYAGVVVFNDPAIIDFIKLHCSTYIFSGSITTPIINASIAAADIHLSNEIVLLQNRLFKNLEFFDSQIINPNNILNYGCPFPIRGLKVGDEHLTIRLGSHFKQQGILASTCLYPTVPKCEGLIRFCISSNHTQKELQKLCQLINQQ